MPPLDVHAVLAMHAIREQHNWEGLDRALALAPVPIIASIIGALPCQLTPRGMPSLGCVRCGYRKCAVFFRFGSGVTSFPLWLDSTSGRRFPMRSAIACIAIWAPLATTLHVLFQCSATQAARAPYAHLFPPAGCSMLEFIHRADTRAVARCILACLRV